MEMFPLRRPLLKSRNRPYLDKFSGSCAKQCRTMLWESGRRVPLRDRGMYHLSGLSSLYSGSDSRRSSHRALRRPPERDRPQLSVALAAMVTGDP